MGTKYEIKIFSRIRIEFPYADEWVFRTEDRAEFLKKLNAVEMLTKSKELSIELAVWNDSFSEEELKTLSFEKIIDDEDTKGE